MMKKTLALLMALMLLFSAPLSALAVDTPQIPANGRGGTNDTYYSSDGVRISKTIEPVTNGGNLVENYFDITLKAELKKSQLLKKRGFDTELVIVLDISNTMNARTTYNNQSMTRLEALKQALYGFVGDIVKDKDTQNKYYLTLVAFASNASRVMNREPITAGNQERINGLIKGVKSETSGSYQRFTNIEGGLRLAYNNLTDNDESKDMDNRFVMLMTDGFPTTYNVNPSDGSSTYISGYNPYMTTNRKLGNGTSYTFRKRYTGSSDQTDQTYNYNRYSGQYGQRGFFANARDGEVTLYGTSYSDWGAYYAQQTAKKMKNEGINIFSVGVDIGEQSIRAYDANAVNVLDLMTFADVRKYADKSSLPNSNSRHMGIIGTGSNGNDTCSPRTYENWLGNVVGGGDDIGDNSYYHLNTSSGTMHAKLQKLWEEIEEVNFKRIVGAMTNSDPMGDMVEFQYFYNKNGAKAGNSLTGVSGIGGEDHAVYSTSKKSFDWNLGKSGYVQPNEDTYIYEIKYRVRLKNETTGSGAFVENRSYGTNDGANMHYIVEEGSGGSVTETPRDLGYPDPAVKGYLGELSFIKREMELMAKAAGDPIEAAGFTLTHNSNCSVCKAGKGSAVSGVYTNVGELKSNDKGEITFSNIPSGHEYTLTETTIPPGYGVAVTPPSWQIKVDFDETYIMQDKQWVPFSTLGGFFNNTPQYEMTHVQFQAEKTVQNVDAFNDGLFAFTLIVPTGNEDIAIEDVNTGLPYADGRRSVTVTNQASESGSAVVQFPRVHFGKPGTYSFTLAETGISAAGSVIGDSTVYTITVTVAESNLKLPSSENGNKKVLEVTGYKLEKMSGGGKSTLIESTTDRIAVQKLLDFVNVHELTEFSFTKQEPDGRKLGGVAFTLTHADSCNCGYTFGALEAVSDANGSVKFTNVRLGHTYVLSEETPAGYEEVEDKIIEVFKNQNGNVTVTNIGNMIVENIPQYVPELVRIHGMKDVHPENTDLDIALRKTNAFKFILTQITGQDKPQAMGDDERPITSVTVGNGEVEQPDDQIRSAFAFLSSEVKLVLPKEQEASPNGFEFPYIHINEPGTYVFTIYEEDSGKHGIDYDDTVYRWTIEAVRGEVDEVMNGFVLNLRHKLEKAGPDGEFEKIIGWTENAEELTAEITFENILETVDFSFAKASFYNQHPLNGSQFTLYHLHALSESDYSEELQPETMIPIPDNPEDIPAQDDEPAAENDDLLIEDELPAEEPTQDEMDLREQHAHDNCPDCAFYIANQTATAVPGTVDGVAVEGLVTFRNVPAGHRYLLVETKPPMDFDPITPVVITVTEEDGKAVVEGISVDLSDPVLDIPTYGKADLTLAAKKLVNGREPKEDQFFYFDLIELVEGEDGTVEEIVLEEAVTNDGSEIVFGTITYEWRDSYHYVIREKQRKELDPELGQEPVGSLVYDKTLYHVLVEVVVENGQLTTKVTYRRNETGKPEVFDPEAGRIPIFRNSSKPAATGDESRLALYAALALCCALAAVALRRRAKAN